MAFQHVIGFILLAIFLIVSGILTAFGIGNPTVRIILAVLEVIAGVFILIGNWYYKYLLIETFKTGQKICLSIGQA